MAHANPKQPPRFLPTLTEVVRQGARSSKASSAMTPDAEAIGPGVDVDLDSAAPEILQTLDKAISKSGDKSSSKGAGKGFAGDLNLSEVDEAVEVNVSRVLLRLEAPMLAKIRRSVVELVDAHIRRLSPLIDKEIETIVREAVREGVTAELVRVRKQSG